MSTAYNCMDNDASPASTGGHTVITEAPLQQAQRDWRGRTTLTVEEAGFILGIGRSSAYFAARTGDIPTVRIGRRLLVPVLSLRRMLGEVTPETSNALAGENQGAAATSTAGHGRHEPE
jgi:hypothetical protein